MKRRRIWMISGMAEMLDFFWQRDGEIMVGCMCAMFVVAMFAMAVFKLLL